LKKANKELEKLSKKHKGLTLVSVGRSSKMYDVHNPRESVNEISAKKGLEQVVKGNTKDVEGIKVSKEMAQAMLDWFNSSPYGRKYPKAKNSRLHISIGIMLSFGLERYAKHKGAKQELKYLKSMRESVNEATIKGQNRKTGETFGMVIGSDKKNKEGNFELTIRVSYSSRISSYKFTFNSNNELINILDYGYSMDGRPPDMKGSGSGKSVKADKRKTIIFIAKITSPAFANKIYKHLQKVNESVNEAKFNKKKVLSSLEKALKNPRIGAQSIQSFIDDELANMGNRYKGSESKISDRDYDKAMSYMEDLFDSEDFGGEYSSQKEVSKLKKDLLKHLKKAVQEGGLPSTENESVNESKVETERYFGKKGIIIMIRDGNNMISAVFKDKKNADKFNRNKPADVKKLVQLAKKTKFPKAIDESLHEGKKRYNVMHGVGSSKYTVNFHNGKSKHNDGSDFFDIAIFKNKRDLAKKINDLTKQGYIYSYQEGFASDAQRRAAFANGYEEKGKKGKKESVNEASREAMGIAGFTGTRGSAVQKFIDDYNLNARKLFNFVKKGKLKDRMDFVTAIAGKPGNKFQGKMVGMFGEGNEDGVPQGYNPMVESKTKESKVVQMIYKYEKNEKKFYDKMAEHERRIGTRDYAKFIIMALKGFGINPREFKRVPDAEEKLYQIVSKK
jgi:hypothetical protein